VDPDPQPIRRLGQGRRPRAPRVRSGGTRRRSLGPAAPDRGSPRALAGRGAAWRGCRRWRERDILTATETLTTMEFLGGAM
jgi:hypothetical protein